MLNIYINNEYILIDNVTRMLLLIVKNKFMSNVNVISD